MRASGYATVLIHTVKHTIHFKTNKKTCMQNLWKIITNNMKMKMKPFLTETVTIQEIKIYTGTITKHQIDKINRLESEKLSQNNT